MKRIIFFTVIILFSGNGIHAQALSYMKERMHGLEIYPDIRNKSVFYYGPGDVEIQRDETGKPNILFLNMRNIGTAATGNQGKMSFKSLLDIALRYHFPSSGQLDSIRADLKTRCNCKPELKAMAVRKMNAVLVYALIGDEKNAKPAATGKDIHIESAEEEREGEEGFWNERTMSASLDPFSAQALAAAFDKGQVLMSIGYAIYADGFASDSSTAKVSFSGDLAGMMDSLVFGDEDQAEPDTSTHIALVKSNVLSVVADLKKYPGILKKVDMNELWAPPAYAALDIRCYDFNNALRDDLYAKKVEVEAAGMDGRPVKQSVSFFSGSPDVYTEGVRFKYAVRMDKPYKYRVVEIKNDAAPLFGKWIQRNDWHTIIDVTTKL